MKKTKTGKVLLLLGLGVVLLGVGYALVANISLTINGTATVSAKYTDDFDVYFSEYTSLMTPVQASVADGSGGINDGDLFSLAPEGSFPSASLVYNSSDSRNPSLKVSVDITSKTTADISVLNMKEGEAVRVYIPVLNDSTDIPASISYSLTNSNSTNFDISAAVQNSAGVVGAFSPKTTGAVLVTVYAKSAEAISEASCSFTVNMTAEPILN